MNIQDLPPSVSISLDSDQGIKYPKGGDFEETYEVELICFGKKHYLKTWPLRQRLMDVFTNMGKKLDGLIEQAETDEKTEGEEDSAMNWDNLMNACLMGGFDALAAIEEFKQLAVANKLIKLDDDVYMNKQRWESVDDDVKEKILFTYLANFIQPCVL